jgi:hypothetical protein
MQKHRKSFTGGHIRLFPGNSTPYRLIWVMCDDGKMRQRLEHRLIMSEIIGRKLSSKEYVHHKDGNGLNNDPDNLELMSARDHQRHHLMGLKWDIDAAIALREAGASFIKIGEKMGVAPSCVMVAFKRRGIATADLRWGKNKWDVAAAIVMFANNKNLSEIGCAFGVRSSSVKKAFLKRGVL